MSRIGQASSTPFTLSIEGSPIRSDPAKEMGPLSSHPQHVGADRNPQCMQYASGFQRKEYEGVMQHASYRPIKSLCRVILPHKSRLLSTSVSMHTTHFTVPDTRGNGCREREIDGVNEREKRTSTDCKGKEVKGHDTEVMEVYGFRALASRTSTKNSFKEAKSREIESRD
jgi:hypothetical protein